MTHLLDERVLSADDVLLIPRLGLLSSRSEAIIQPYLYSAPMDTVTGYELTKALVEQGHIAVVSREIPTEELLRCIKEYGSHPQVFFAISLAPDWVKLFLEALLAQGVDQPVNVAIDCAHGDMKTAHDLATWLTATGVCRYIMSGSICTVAAAERAIVHGCTHLRVGVGPGSMCTTRIMTGCGYPQLSAVYQIGKLVSTNYGHLGVQVIADGGVRSPGDAVKYLAAGADGVMMGGQFAKAIEAVGWFHNGWKEPQFTNIVEFPIPDPEPLFSKKVRGHASASFQKTKGKTSACPEGASTLIDWDGTKLEHIVGKFEGGLSSAISYLGLKSTSELSPENVGMVQITNATIAEGKPHGT